MKRSKPSDSSQSNYIRKKAEELLKKKTIELSSLHTIADPYRLIQELEVHQIELELINEELRLSQSSMHDSAEKYTELYELAPSGYFTLSRDGKIIELNLFGANMLGKGRPQLVGSLFGFFVTDDAKTTFNNFLGKVFKYRKKEICEVSIIANDLTIRYFHLSGIISKKLDCCLVNAFDNTDQKLAEESLNKSQLRYQKILQTALDGFWIVDMQGNFIDVNQAYCKLIGYPREELIGMSIRDIEALESETDISHRRQYIIKNGSDRFESKHRCKNGKIIDFEISISYLPSDSNIFVFLRDITETRKTMELLSGSESRFRRLYESDLLGIAFWDLNGNINDANNAYLNIVGYSIKDLKSGKVNWSKMTPPEYSELDKNAVEEIRQKGTCGPYEKEYIRKDGSRVNVLIGAASLLSINETGVAYITDITDRKRAEFALFEEIRSLSRLNEYSMGLLKLPVDADVEGFITRQLKDITAARVAVFSEYDPGNRILTTRHIEIENILLDKIVSLLGKHVKSINYSVSDEMYTDMTSTFIGKQKNLYDASLGAISKPKAAAIQALLKVDRFIGLAYITNNKLYGTSLLGLGKDQPDPSKEILDNFIFITSEFLQRKQAEDKLYESQVSLQKAQSVSHVGSWTWNIKEDRVIWSDEMYHIFGINKENFTGLLPDVIRRVIHPDDRAKVENANMLVKTEKNPIPLEYRILRQDGTQRTVWAEAGELIVDDEGIPSMLTGIVQDITERKQVEEEVRKSEKRYHSLFDNMLNGFAHCKMLYDNEGNPVDFIYLEVNKAFGSLTGLTDVIGKRVTEVIPGIRQMDNEIFNIYGRVAFTGVPEHFEMNVLSLNQWFSVSVYCPSKNYFVAIFDVITVRKKNEEKIRSASLYTRSLIEASLDSLVTISTEGKITDANLATERITGMVREKLIGGDFAEHFTEPDRAKRGYKIVFSKGVVRDYPLTILNSKGQKIDVLYNATIYKNEDGEVQGVFAAARDITEQKRLENELKDSKKLLEKLNQHQNEIREKERELISREIHDQLGQTLTSIKIDLNWLSERIVKESQEGSKLSEIINLVTNTTKDVQRISLELRPGVLFDLGLSAALEWYLEDFMTRTGINVFMDLEDIQSENKSTNLTLYRVAQESLTNILRHAAAKNVRIKLCKTEKDILLIIEDDGVGIPREKIGSSRSLGLLGMFERVKQFNGQLEIINPVKGGTRISVSIPLN